jgi:SAM-dependent methyltransferase
MSVQSKEELDGFYTERDPWGYRSNKDDAMRRARLLSVIPRKQYCRVLEIGCGDGFVTSQLPGDAVIGIDLSRRAIEYARGQADVRTTFRQMSLFDLPYAGWRNTFDLIVIAGMLYPQFIGEGARLVTLIVDDLLLPGGHLITAHIFEWYRLRFPYTTLSRQYYRYREYSHVLEAYQK